MTARAEGVRIRGARLDDLPAIVALLADDDLGAQREQAAGADDAYRRAFAEIDADPRSLLLVAESDDGVVVGTLQLTFFRQLTYQGGERAQIEGVRIARDRRGAGLGSALLEAAVGCARRRGCHLVQLTTDKRRDAALVFYERAGFVATHEGLKLHL